MVTVMVSRTHPCRLDRMGIPRTLPGTNIGAIRSLPAQDTCSVQAITMALHTSPDSLKAQGTPMARMAVTAAEISFIPIREFRIGAENNELEGVWQGVHRHGSSYCNCYERSCMV